MGLCRHEADEEEGRQEAERKAKAKLQDASEHEDFVCFVLWYPEPISLYQYTWNPWAFAMRVRSGNGPFGYFQDPVRAFHLIHSGCAVFAMYRWGLDHLVPSGSL
jgi:hypothetical protein